ncbi:hypothetical protein NPIL_702211 [Nephila pilipes]|uniref:Uncharacterized protein n=1 Tax=Nephila pilipes TaxID=299642 RepID=A0A8X6I863_NEPPI|nr:hypothetical protein NPIL_472491 [Nephila pilipes]GFT69516.1 hypothetical protein NPIL_702211 [Nephila pilipes]
MVTVFDSLGQECAVFLDSDSEANFISQSLENKLFMKRYNARIIVKRLGSSVVAVTRGSINIEIATIYGSGANYFFSCLLPGQTVKSINDPIVQNTIFGWVLSDEMKIKNDASHQFHSILKYFLELEEIPFLPFMQQKKNFPKLI